MATSIETRTLHDLLTEQIARRGKLGDRITGTVVLDSGRGGVWTLRFDHGEVTASEGVADERDTLISTTPEALADVIQGRKSGIEAFLEGHIRVRGNLALSLKLDGLFGGPERPVEYPRASYTAPNGIDTFYLEAGTGDPVILLHGLGATNASMLPTLFDLARDHRVIAPDLPG